MSETKNKLTDTQLRVIQVVMGVISSILLLGALYLPNLFGSENVLVIYLWLIVFVVIMFGRRWIERRFKLRLALYNLVMLDTLTILLVIYAAFAMFNHAAVKLPEAFFPSWPLALKLALLIVVGLFVLIAGVIIPLVRYNKRKEQGALRPIRIPEPEEVADETTEMTDENPELKRLSPLERQIMEMTKELDAKKSEEGKK